jgi:hypothetical protein
MEVLMESDDQNGTSMEPCPHCNLTLYIRPKLILVDKAWNRDEGGDSRMAHASYLRADDLKPEVKREQPLQQFVDGFYCDGCNEGFVPDRVLKEREERRIYYFGRTSLRGPSA